MRTYEQEGWHIFEEKTRRPIEQLKTEATRALFHGLSGLVTVHEWKGNRLKVRAAGSEAELQLEGGSILCRVRCRSFPANLPFMKSKILSDVAAAVREVSGVQSGNNKNVFVVHGHDARAKWELKDFLLGLGLAPIILNEQDDKGMTIIEKFEFYASLCSFAFILFTPDDVSVPPTDAGKVSENFRWRARQNVILEMGWFIARLGRERVAVLHRGDVEVPSDVHGVLYASFDRSVRETTEQIRQRLQGAGLID